MYQKGETGSCCVSLDKSHCPFVSSVPGFLLWELGELHVYLILSSLLRMKILRPKNTRLAGGTVFVGAMPRHWAGTDSRGRRKGVPPLPPSLPFCVTTRTPASGWGHMTSCCQWNVGGNWFPVTSEAGVKKCTCLHVPSLPSSRKQRSCGPREGGATGWKVLESAPGGQPLASQPEDFNCVYM